MYVLHGGVAVTSPTQRTLAYCRAEGWIPAVVERWNQYAQIRQDLYGFLDLLVMDDKPGLLGVQCTSGSNAAARMEKIGAEPKALHWLLRGLRVEVWGWRKVKGKRGGRLHWDVRRLAARVTEDCTVEWDEVANG